MALWTNLLFLVFVFLGIAFFLYGANYYDNIVGWAGVYLFVGAILARVILFVYSRLGKNSVQTSTV